MNQLPGFRRVINGRTFAQSWPASDFDPIQRYPSQSRIGNTVYAVVCIAACICIGLLIVSGI